ncbi:MAG: response regulator [Nitrospirota bacterium]
MSTILIIDDDDAFLKFIRTYVHDQYPRLNVLTCDDPVRCLTSITKDLDLLLVDLEMPGLDGAKVLAYATSKGIDKKRIIIFSGRDADYLHKRFPMGSCLAVLNKFEVQQQAVLDMIFSSLQDKRSPSDDTDCPLR